MAADQQIVASLTYPSRGRAAKAARMIESVEETVGLDEVEILIYLDEDDPTLNDYQNSLSQWSGRNVYIVVGPAISISKSWNSLAARARGELLLISNDDLVYQTKNWHLILQESVRLYQDRIFCAWFDDGINGERHVAFPIVSQAWYQTLGYLTPGIFEFLCNDSWLMDIGQRVGRMHYIDCVKTEHHHFGAHKSEFDETYRRNRQGKTQRDLKLYHETTQLREQEAEKLRAAIERYALGHQDKKTLDLSDRQAIPA